jgi:hypothetical protein
MATTLLATQCPHCKKPIKVPGEFAGKNVRCKGCSEVFTVKGDSSSKHAPVAKANVKPMGPVKPAASDPVPAAKPKSEKPAPAVATVDNPSFVKKMARQQRSSSILFLVIAVLALAVLGVGGFMMKDKIVAMFEGKPEVAQPTQPKGETGLLTKGEKLDNTSGDLTNLPDPMDQEKQRKRKLAKIPEGYPGRALLIGIRNYLYLNPINPGYRVERSFLGDPLGLISLRRVLLTELSFGRDQVVALSDVDDIKPSTPSKANIEATVTEFLTNSRASDRVVLVLAVHACHLAGKTYLIPIEGELPAEGAKADAERDAKLAAGLIPLSWLYEKLAACPARQKLLILDIAQSDPEAGNIRTNPGPLTEAMFDEIKKTPTGTQVWLPCQAKQYSVGLISANKSGSAFMDWLCQLCIFSVEKNWKLVKETPGLKEGTLPLVLVAREVEKEVTADIKDKGYEQTPVLLGEEGKFTGTEASTPAPPVKLVLNKAEGVLANTELELIMKELSLNQDQYRRLTPSSFPPLLASKFVNYKADYASAKELEEKLNDMPLRMMTLRAVKVLDRSLTTFRMRFAHEADEQAFKRKIEKDQESPAFVTAELGELLEEMKKLEEKRDAEPSKRWQAHFDYTQARVLAQLAHVQEYSFVLGNKLRKDTPPLKDAKNHNGWIIIPQKKLEQKETRTYETERQKLLTKIIKEHAGTPWEVLARREQATILGLTLQETFLEEYKK